MQFEDIPFTHPDFLRITSSLTQDRCPDCDAYGFELGPRGALARNMFCLGCGAGFNVTVMLGHVLFVQRIQRKLR